MAGLTERAAAVRLVIFDIDGVLTDGRLYFGDDGQEYKAFNSLDGHGMVMLRDSGVEIGIISGRRSQLVRHRMQALGVQHLYQGQKDKRTAYAELKDKLDLEDHQIAYVGDDVIDLPVMTRVGLAVAVADAHALVREHAHWVTAERGGHGAAREVCDFIMAAQGTLERLLARYLDL